MVQVVAHLTSFIPEIARTSAEGIMMWGLEMSLTCSGASQQLCSVKLQLVLSPGIPT